MPPFTKASKKKRARDELLRVAAAVIVNPDDVIGFMKERHQDMSNASRDELHVLYNAIAAEIAVKRAKALIAEVDKEP